MQLPGDKNVTAASGPVRERDGWKEEEGVRGRWGRAGEATGGFHSYTHGAQKRGGKKNTITDEKMRCEEGKMLLLEAFFSNQ